MKQVISRREMLAAGLVIAGDAALSGGADGFPLPVTTVRGMEKTRMKLGLITYNVAKDWDLPTILDHVKKAGWDGVELRTTHAHGVELSLDAAGRREVRQRIADA